MHDPHIQLGEIYGSNQRYIMNAIPHIGNLLDDQLGRHAGMGRPCARGAKAVAPDSSVPGGQREAAGGPGGRAAAAHGAHADPRLSMQTVRTGGFRLRGESHADRRRRGLCPRALPAPRRAWLGKRALLPVLARRRRAPISRTAQRHLRRAARTPGNSPRARRATSAAILKAASRRHPASSISQASSVPTRGWRACAALPKSVSPTRVRIPRAMSPPAGRPEAPRRARLNLP